MSCEACGPIDGWASHCRRCGLNFSRCNCPACPECTVLADNRAFSEWIQARAAELVPSLPDGYIIKQLKNGRWVGKHPYGDVVVKASNREECIHVLRLAVLSDRHRS